MTVRTAPTTAVADGVAGGVAHDAAPAVGLDRYLIELTKVVFQSGMGRAVVEAKWDGLMEAFEGFDPSHVAELSPADVDALVGDARVIRNRRKIEATVANAGRLLDLDGGAGDGSGVRAWLRSFESEAARDRAVVDAFTFLGPGGVHQFLYGVAESVSMDCEVTT